MSTLSSTPLSTPHVDIPHVDIKLTSSLAQSLSPESAIAVYYNWSAWARSGQFLSPNEWTGQLEPPGDWWTYWLILAGRGWGKTRCVAEYIRLHAPSINYLNLVGATADDARDILVEGESGVLSICPKAERPRYVKNERKLVWPSGSISLIFTADEPDRFRGKQHGGLAIDEPASFRYGQEAIDMALFGLRLGRNPRAVFSTTPRPIKLIRDLISDPKCVITRGHTDDNAANLAPAFIHKIISRYAGTRLERQERFAEILTDTPGALWNADRLDRYRISRDKLPSLARIVVAVDPPGTEPDIDSAEEGTATECGIVACGIDNQDPPHGYCLEDHSREGSPLVWAQAAVDLYHYLQADRLVGEINFGGTMVEFTIRMVDRNVSYKGVHASRGKVKRAEPIAALDEQGRWHMVGAHAKLEDEMTTYTGKKVPGQKAEKSPNRMDALVWAATELFEDEFGYVSEGYAWGNGGNGDD